MGQSLQTHAVKPNIVQIPKFLNKTNGILVISIHGELEFGFITLCKYHRFISVFEQVTQDTQCIQCEYSQYGGIR